MVGFHVSSLCFRFTLLNLNLIFELSLLCLSKFLLLLSLLSIKSFSRERKAEMKKHILFLFFNYSLFKSLARWGQEEVGAKKKKSQALQSGESGF